MKSFEFDCGAVGFCGAIAVVVAEAGHVAAAAIGFATIAVVFLGWCIIQPKK